MALLNAKYSLLEIDDVEAFTGRIVQRSGLRLSVQDQEELHTYLIESAWELSFKHNPERGPFRSWLGYALRRRVVDWQRSRFGRTRWKFAGRVYERERPQLVSLDGVDADRDRMGEAVAASSLDGDTHSFAADMRTLGARGCRPGRRDESLGDEAA